MNLQMIEAMIQKDYQERLQKLVVQVERSHFRTDADTGANSCAMLIWQYVRREAGLPPLTVKDLPSWCEKCQKYYVNPCTPFAVFTKVS